MNSRGMVFSADDVEIAINRRQNFVLAPCVDKLSLNGIKVDAEGMKYLSKALKMNTTLTQLDLSVNNLTDEGVKPLSKSLHVNTTLTQLNLSNTNMKDKGVKCLSDALQVNTTLTHLNLSYNNVEAEGVKYLSKSLQLRSKTLPDQMVLFLNEGSMPDVTLISKNGEQMRAHRIVLAARSRFFRDTLEKTNHQADALIEVDIPSQDLYKLLHYLYSGELDVPSIKTSSKRHEFVRSLTKLIPEHEDRITKLVTALSTKSGLTDAPMNNSSSSIKEMLWAVNNSLFHDVAFVVSDSEKNVRRIPAHKVVLCARSSYFNAMLTGGMKESQEKEIHINETNPEAFIKVYLYTKDLNVVGTTMAFEFMIETFLLASQYHVVPLKYKLEIMLSLNITVENVCPLLLLSDAHQCVHLKRECCKFFVKHRHNVLQSSKKDYYMEHSIQIDEIIDSVCYTAPDNERHDTY